MRSTFAALAVAAAVIVGSFTARLSGSTGPIPLNCDRACLEGLIDQYLKAVVAHDPSKLPLSEDVKYSENYQMLKVGDGFWKTAELADLETRAAWAELLAARATWEASSGTIEQAQRAYQIANVRFSAGVSTQLELSDSRLLLQQAEANRAQSARDLQVARARVALLPELPLATSGTVAATAAAARVLAPLQQTPAPVQPSGGGQFRSATFVSPGSAGVQ